MKEYLKCGSLAQPRNWILHFILMTWTLEASSYPTGRHRRRTFSWPQKVLFLTCSFTVTLSTLREPQFQLYSLMICLAYSWPPQKWNAYWFLKGKQLQAQDQFLTNTAGDLKHTTPCKQAWSTKPPYPRTAPFTPQVFAKIFWRQSQSVKEEIPRGPSCGQCTNP